MPPAAGTTSGSGWIRVTTHNVKEGTDFSEYVTVELLGTLASNETLQVDLSTFDFSGPASAQNPSDHGSLPTYVTFTAGGVTSLTSMLSITNDIVEEPNWERFRVDAAPSLKVNGTTIQTFSTLSSMVWIEDDDTNVTIATANDTTEGSGTPGKFIVSRAYPDTQDVTVYFDNNTGTALRNSDYTSPGSVVIAAGTTSTEVLIPALADNLVEGDETVTLTAMTGFDYSLAYHPNATLTIHDNPATISISAPSQHASEAGPTQVTVTFTRSGGDITQQLPVTVDITGSAINGTDYNTLPTTVTFLANETTKTLTVTPRPDGLVEGEETISLTLLTPALPANLCHG
jgi:hypothetical protein